VLSKEDVASLPAGTPVWLVGTRDVEGQAPWQTQKDSRTRRFLAHGECAAFRTEHDAKVWHAQRLAGWARAEAARLLKVARGAEKRAKALASKGVVS
jgi:hypothetical protein